MGRYSGLVFAACAVVLTAAAGFALSYGQPSLAMAGTSGELQ